MIFQISGPSPHSFTSIGNDRHFRVRRAYFLPEPDHVDVSVLISPSTGPANDTYRVVTGVPSSGTRHPFVAPTVPSGQVMFPRLMSTMFNATPQALIADDVVATMKADGMNHVLCGGWVANAAWTTFAQWQAGFDSQVKPNIEWALANGYYVVLEGDNVMSTAGLQALYYGAAWRQQATQYAGAYFAQTGICSFIEMDDEVGPDPNDYGQPSLFVNDWRGVNGPSIGWCNQAPTNWESGTYDGIILADHASRFQATQEARNGLPGKIGSYWQNRTASTKRDQNPAPPLTMPYVGSIACVGEFYLKYVPGDHYQVGDVLNAGHTRPQAIITQIWLLMADGASGWRMYAYDWPNWRNGRANGTTDGSVQQTGCWPGDPRWSGCRIAMRSVMSRESVLLGTHYVPTTSGPWTFGRRGALTFGINTSEHALPSPNGHGLIISDTGEESGDIVPGGGVILWGV